MNVFPNITFDELENCNISVNDLSENQPDFNHLKWKEKDLEIKEGLMIAIYGTEFVEALEELKIKSGKNKPTRERFL